jgi:hypothetical protein
LLQAASMAATVMNAAARVSETRMGVYVIDPPLKKECFGETSVCAL